MNEKKANNLSDEEKIWRSRFSWTLWIVYMSISALALVLIITNTLGLTTVGSDILKWLIGATIAHTASIFMVILRHFYPKREVATQIKIDRSEPDLDVTEEEEIPG